MSESRRPPALKSGPRRRPGRPLDQGFDEAVEATRMSIGEHLDELRTRLVRALLGLLAGCLLAIWPSQYVLAWTIQPLMLAQQANGQPTGLLATGPTEPLMWYIKVVLFVGALISSPYVIHQLWSFVAAGLYTRERAVIHRYVPYSVGLFLAGVAFMYTFVLVLSLNFLIGFSSWFPVPGVESTALQDLLMGHTTPPAATQPVAPDAGGLPRAPLLASDPADPAPGTLWFNLRESALKIHAADGRTYTRHFDLDLPRRASVTTHFRIGEYLSFVLLLAIAFGLAFQVPLVVMALVRTGIVTRDQFRSYRRMVILVIVIVAGAIAPPDLLSHILLSVPMWLLFELGLVLSRPRPKGDTSEAS